MDLPRVLIMSKPIVLKYFQEAMQQKDRFHLLWTEKRRGEYSGVKCERPSDGTGATKSSQVKDVGT